MNDQITPHRQSKTQKTETSPYSSNGGNLDQESHPPNDEILFKVNKPKVYPILVGVIFLLFFISNLTFLMIDLSPPKTDESIHLLDALRFHDELKTGKIAQFLFPEERYYPPIIFQWTAFFYFISGTSEIASVLSQSVFWLMLIVSTYLFTKEIFDEDTALLASSASICYPAIFNFSHEYFLDIPLTGITAFSYYLLLKTDSFKNHKFIFPLFISLSVGMLIKWSLIFYIGVPFLIYLTLFILDNISKTDDNQLKSHNPPNDHEQTVKSPDKANEEIINPSNNHKQTKNPSNAHEQTKNPSNNHKQTKNPSNAHEQTKNPSNNHEQTKNPSNNHKQTKNPSNNHEQTKNPSNNHKQADNPSNPHEQTKNPSNNHKQADNPSNPHEQTKNPSNNHKQTKNPSNPHEQTKKPSNNHEQTKNPSNVHEQTKKTPNAHEQADKPIEGTALSPKSQTLILISVMVMGALPMLLAPQLTSIPAMIRYGFYIIMGIAWVSISFTKFFTPSFSSILRGIGIFLILAGGFYLANFRSIMEGLKTAASAGIMEEDPSNPLIFLQQFVVYKFFGIIPATFLLIGIVTYTITKDKNRERNVLLISALIPLLILTLLPNKDPRYLFPIASLSAPFVVLWIPRIKNFDFRMGFIIFFILTFLLGTTGWILHYKYRHSVECYSFMRAVIPHTPEPYDWKINEISETILDMTQNKSFVVIFAESDFEGDFEFSGLFRYQFKKLRNREGYVRGDFMDESKMGLDERGGFAVTTSEPDFRTDAQLQTAILVYFYKEKYQIPPTIRLYLQKVGLESPSSPPRSFSLPKNMNCDIYQLKKIVSIQSYNGKPRHPELVSGAIETGMNSSS